MESQKMEQAIFDAENAFVNDGFEPLSPKALLRLAAALFQQATSGTVFDHAGFEKKTDENHLHVAIVSNPRKAETPDEAFVFAVKMTKDRELLTTAQIKFSDFLQKLQRSEKPSKILQENEQPIRSGELPGPNGGSNDPKPRVN